MLRQGQNISLLYTLQFNSYWAITLNCQPLQIYNFGRTNLYLQQFEPNNAIFGEFFFISHRSILVGLLAFKSDWFCRDSSYFSSPRGSFEQIATKCKINKKTPTYFDNSSTSNSILLPRGKVINPAGFQNLFCPQCITFQSSKRLLNLKCITSIAKRQKHSQGAKENLVNIFIGLKVDFQKLHSTYDCLFFYVKSCTAFLMDYYLIDLNFTT